MVQDSTSLGHLNERGPVVGSRTTRANRGWCKEGSKEFKSSFVRPKLSYMEVANNGSWGKKIQPIKKTMVIQLMAEEAVKWE